MLIRALARGPRGVTHETLPGPVVALGFLRECDGGGRCPGSSLVELGWPRLSSVHGRELAQRFCALGTRVFCFVSSRLLLPSLACLSLSAVLSVLFDVYFFILIWHCRGGRGVRGGEREGVMT